ncbi:hypothetical protein K466DRAFT_505001 [Polyporus arcularius HHB13444]|uniref:Uncharacterized protein n=1 Tax=Polyporus arcularius HHB13444 TaxID=1314778 RepID=A0A5C3NUW7_9APHY|nr:hypothetical protein K466DRAFT_505001 [Polyporus arcularius HHB13444]
MLFLPSDLDRSSFHAAACTSLGAFELRLRIAHAYDFIASLKMSLALKAATIQSKVRNARGTRNNIVAQKEVSQANQAVVHLAKQYNDNHRRMKALATLLKGSQYETTIPVSLKTIDLAKDLAPANLHTARTLGDSKKTDSWIFSVAPPGADRGQVSRVRWVRAWANFLRTNEEVNLLYAEARAAHTGFLTFARIRRETAAAKSEYASRGATAYALQKAAMFTSMAGDVLQRVSKVTATHRAAMEKDDDRRVAYYDR